MVGYGFWIGDAHVDPAGAGRGFEVAEEVEEGQGAGG